MTEHLNAAVLTCILTPPKEEPSIEAVKATAPLPWFLPTAPGSSCRLPALFALSKKGTLRTYKIEVLNYKDHSVVTTSKSVTEGGKWQTDTYEYWHGVNIGKSNETTFQQQAYSEANSMWKKLRDAGFSTEKPKEGEKFNTDANGSMKPMLAIPFNEKKIQFPCLVQPKYDGVRCLIFEKDGEVQIISRKGKPYDIPHIKKWAEEHRECLPLDGELYNHGELTFQEIVSAVKRKSEITEKIRYVVYDQPVADFCNIKRWNRLILTGGVVPDSSMLPKGVKKKPSDLRPEWQPVYLSDYAYAQDMEQLEKLHNDFVRDGYEGCIIRNLEGTYEFGFRSNDLIKMKSFMDSEYEIIDVLEANGRDAGTAIFVCKCEAGVFNVKPQGTRELRAKYWKERRKLIGKMVTVKYQELSDDGIPRFPSAISVRDYE